MNTKPFQDNRIAVNQGVYLSEIGPPDKTALVGHLNDPEIYRQTLRIPCPYREAEAEKFLALVAKSTAQHGHPVHFAIRNAEGNLLGGLGFDGLVYGHRAEIGYWLGRKFWGHGTMTQVVGAACAFAFAQWKLVRIMAHVFEFNIASARVLEKNGFQLEGRLRKHHRKGDAFLDSRLYALVK